MLSEQRRGLITGGTGGLGGAVTRAFVEAAYPVATTYTDPEKWESLGDLKDGSWACGPISWTPGRSRKPRGGRRRSSEGFTPS